MALHTIDQYFEKNRLKNEAFFTFVNRVLVPKFGGAARAFYDKESKFIYVKGANERLLTEIKRKKVNDNAE